MVVYQRKKPSESEVFMAAQESPKSKSCTNSIRKDRAESYSNRNLQLIPYDEPNTQHVVTIEHQNDLLRPNFGVCTTPNPAPNNVSE